MPDPTPPNERLQYWLEFSKWFIVSMVLAGAGIFLDTGLKDHAAGIAELQVCNRPHRTEQVSGAAEGALAVAGNGGVMARAAMPERAVLPFAIRARGGRAYDQESTWCEHEEDEESMYTA